MKSTTRHPALSLLAPLTLILLLSTAGCQVWVKRGAGQADLQTDQTACKAESGGSSDNAAFASCMTGKGWYNENAAAQSSSSADTSASSPTTSSSTTGAAPAAAAGMVAVGSGAMSGTSAGTSSSPAAATPAPAAPVPPAAPATVNSWWKLGGGTGELFSTREQCGEQTGDPATDNRYSQAFIDCMKDHKWFAMR